VKGFDRGTVTAEFAVVLPAVVVVALILMSLGRAVIVNASCQDAARSVAEHLSVQLSVQGEVMPDSVLQDELKKISDSAAHEATTVEVSQNSVGKEVTVICPLLPGPMGILPANVTGHALALIQ
jgi:predicted RecB family endonuclease